MYQIEEGIMPYNWNHPLIYHAELIICWRWCTKNFRESKMNPMAQWLQKSHCIWRFLASASRIGPCLAKGTSLPSLFYEEASNSPTKGPTLILDPLLSVQPNSLTREWSPMVNKSRRQTVPNREQNKETR